MKSLSNRLFGTSGSETKRRPRSQSIVHLADVDASTMKADGSNTNGNAYLSIGSLNRSQSRFASGWSHRSPSPYSDGQEKRSPSPLPNGLVRRFSVLGSKSNRSLSPLPGSTEILNLNGLSTSIVGPSRGDTDSLGRSVSDRSTTSSTGYLPMGRMGPLRRQSTHLVPPVVGSFELQAQPSRKVLSTSNSVERLDSINNKLTAGDDAVSATNPVHRRTRALSNASSAAGNASTSGLHNKLAKLLSRGTNEKSSMPDLVPADAHASEQALHRRNSEVGTLQFSNNVARREIQADPVIRSHASRDTLASHTAFQSRPSSPLPRDSPGRQALSNGLDTANQPPPVDTKRQPADMDFDKADWEGDLSDDEDDYGEPVSSVYGRPGLHGSVDGVPGHPDDLNRGTWVMNGRGWQHRETTGTLLPSVIPRDSNMETNGDLQMDIGAIMPDSGFSPSHVPATIAETDAELDAENAVSDKTRLTINTNHNTLAIGSRSPMSSPRQASHSEQERTVRHSPGSANRAPSQQRWPDRPRLPSTNEMFDDAEEDDDEDDGLEIDVGLKRGRRSSKPLTPAMDRRPSLPPI
jgi:hypothetical protein